MKLRADTSLIKLQFLALTGIVVATVLGMSSIASMLFTLTFFLTVGLWLVVEERKIGRLSLLAILIIFISCICVLTNALITNTILSFSYLKKMIMFWSTVIFFATMCEYKPDRSVAAFLFRLNTLTVLMLLGMYVTQTDYMYLMNDRVSNYLTFRFTNSNLTAVFLSAVCIIELLCAYASEKRLQRYFHVLLAGILVYFVILTEARNALLLMVLFLTVFLMTVLFPRLRLRMTGWMAALIAVFPFLFAVVYMLVVDSTWFQTLFSFLVSEGKPLNSRVGMWSDALGAIGASPIIGAYSQISDGGGSSQMHNSHLDVAASYGIPVLILLCVFLYHTLYGKYGEKRSGMNFVCMAGFAALLMSGIGEAMVFSGGLGIYIYLGNILMLANYNWEKERN